MNLNSIALSLFFVSLSCFCIGSESVSVAKVVPAAPLVMPVNSDPAAQFYREQSEYNKTTAALTTAKGNLQRIQAKLGLVQAENSMLRNSSVEILKEKLHKVQKLSRIMCARAMH